MEAKAAGQGRRLKTLCLDTETQGIDSFHGARPFFCTVCNDDGDQTHWQWEVDVWTRAVTIPPADLVEIRQLLDAAETVVGQNVRFDSRMLAFAGLPGEWPWAKTEDTLIAAHLLASNLPHDLTSLVMQYLGRDISPLEKALEEAVKAARRLCQSKSFQLDHGAFAIASCERSDMPSAKEKTWRYDYWLPRAVAVFLEEKGVELTREQQTWRTVLEEYANADSAWTLLLWPVMKAELNRRGLWKIYRERMRLPAIAGELEGRGVTLSGERLQELEVGFEKESERSGAVCVAIAKARGYDLKLPKSGSNGSLDQFVFGRYREDNNGGKDKRQRVLSADCLNLQPVGWTDGGNPSLDKVSLDTFAATLDGEALLFVTRLRAKRRRDTGGTYLDGYCRYWLPISEAAGWFRLHPSVNPTGTDTLRWSHANPNSSNISKQEERCEECHGDGCPDCGGSGITKLSLRHAFGPAPNREWWSIDAKNIELRLPAFLSGERELIDLFERPDEPPYHGSTHLLNFHTVYPEIWEKELREVGLDKVGPHCKKKYASSNYQWCKNGGFAKQYGAQRFLVDQTFRREGASDALDGRFSRLSDFNRECVSFAEKHGYVETLPDRTVDPEHGYPILCTRTERGRVLPTVPLNYKIQSTAMWWTARAMVKCEEQLEEWRCQGFDAFMTLQVHDELVFDLPKRAHPKRNPKASNLGRIRVLQELMESCGMDLVPSIPTPCNVEFHETTWAIGETC